MFHKISTTSNPPQKKPLLIWDGQCGFCKYWLLYLKAHIGDRLDYEPFQEIHKNYDDISLKEFKKASRLIDVDGKVYSGPDSLYKSLAFFKKPNHWIHKAYRNNFFFRRLSDKGYDWVSKNRPALYKLTVLLFGKNPAKQKPYWVAGLVVPAILTLVAGVVWKR